MGSQRELTRLHEILAERFDAEELRTLYFRLGIGYDDLGGEGKLGKARELVAFLERRGRIGELIATGKQLRPDVAWDVEDAAAPSPTPILRPERLRSDVAWDVEDAAAPSPTPILRPERLRYKPGGALTDDHTLLYIERRADRDARMYLRVMDYLLLVEPRQQGKTSLINALMRHTGFNDVMFACIDVTTLDHSSEPNWYKTLCPRISRQIERSVAGLNLPTIPSNSAEWRDYLWVIAAAAMSTNRRILIAFDEIGAITFPGVTQFFAVLRDVYNSRQVEPEFKQLSFLLSGAFNPRDLIKDDKISPFNIAQQVCLTDFTLDQVRTLVQKGGWSEEQITQLAERIWIWTDGQPYLTQLLCSYLGPDATVKDVDAGVERLRREDSNHLPPLLKRLSTSQGRKLHNYLRQVLSGEQIKYYPRENRRQAQLELLGWIKADSDGYCRIRNRLYRELLVFADQSAHHATEAGGNQPDEELARRREDLQKRRIIHQRNLWQLYEQKASYGLSIPPSVSNQIAHDEQQIARIEDELRELGEDKAPDDEDR